MNGIKFKGIKTKSRKWIKTELDVVTHAMIHFEECSKNVTDCSKTPGPVKFLSKCYGLALKCLSPPPKKNQKPHVLKLIPQAGIASMCNYVWLCLVFSSEQFPFWSCLGALSHHHSWHRKSTFITGDIKSLRSCISLKHIIRYSTVINT